MIDDFIQPLLAVGAGDVISVLIGLLVLVFYVIGQINEAKKTQPVPRRPNDQADRFPRQSPQKPQESARRDMEQLWEQAGKEGKESEAAAPIEGRAAAPKPAAAQRSVEVLIDDGPDSGTHAASRRGVSATSTREAPAVQDEPGSPARRSWSAPSAPQPAAPPVPVPASITPAAAALGAGQFVWQPSQLGKRVASADTKLQSHLHAMFDHDVGHLVGRPSKDAYALRVNTNEAMQRVVESLTRPQGVQQAILLSEILNRPNNALW